MSSLRTRFDPRQNSFDVLRLLFALLVAMSHGVAIRTGHQAQWGRSTLGDFGLDGFFILSGFLVTRSWLTLDSFPRFAWHRFLRIMPGFWMCLLLTALVVAPIAAWAQGMPSTTPFTGAPSALRYLFGNSALLIVQYDIAGILADTPQGASFNGALWTLFFEAFCYVIIAGLGVLGVLRNRRIVVPVMLGVLAVLTILQEAGLPVLVNDRILRLTFVFLLGAAAYLYADRLPMRTDLAVASAGIFLLSVSMFEDYRVLGAAPLAYLFIWFGTCFRWPWSIRTDLSYGMYIYHWPTMQLLVLTGVGTVAVPSFLLIGLGITAAMALLSWLLVERPALRRKHSTIPDRVAEATRGGRSRSR
ncbi:acyltransferase [Pseudonocardia sp. KRD291]|uniref:acyltransferase family protein n=1 Tax=Pseudonocardia sp. KRD291 TaxID=2792007 RepID=UPI001C4A2A91|nr:acyltransferase [Pseudonocardia sp. KRD291]MBW0102086.1 acyltransferase [Pseudonocardia sp. KRD291]